jgi:hypothetical protein
VDSESGKLLEEHGKGQFYMPHGLTIDGKGNIWLTDVGSHQVHKLDKKFNLEMSIGEKLVPGYVLGRDRPFGKRGLAVQIGREALLQADGCGCGQQRRVLRGRRLLQQPDHEVRQGGQTAQPVRASGL